jgi:hydroxyacylglutathione hydrolase
MEMAVKIDSLAVGEFQVNCYLAHGTNGQALVIDPGSEAGHILAFIKARNVSVAAYVLTHGHVDHISALADLCAAAPAPVAMHAEDAKWAFSGTNQMPPFYPVPRRPPEIGRVLKDGQIWQDAGLTYTIIGTPGHTPGSVCLYFPTEGAIFTGDTLFAGSVGRTDLPGGNPRALPASLEKLARLPDTAMVYPGHGPDTDIGQEKQTNDFMQGFGGQSR